MRPSGHAELCFAVQHPRERTLPLLFHRRHAHALPRFSRHRHQPERRRMRDLVVRDIRIITKTEVGAKQPIGDFPEDDDTLEPTLSRTLDLRTDALDVLGAGHLGLLRRPKLVPVISRALRVRIRQRDVLEDGLDARFNQRRAVPLHAFARLRVRATILVLENFVKRQPSSIAEERNA